MSDMNLNPGGFIGALVGGGIALVIALPSLSKPNPGRGVYRLPVFGIIGGAFAGNYLWSLVFDRPEKPKPRRKKRRRRPIDEE